MNKNEIIKLFLINFFAIAFINMNQSLIPTIIKNIEMSSFVFGVFLAITSISNLIFAPILGDLSDLSERKKFLIIGLFGYSVFQLMFVNVTSSVMAILVRFVSGIFLAGYLTSAMAYLIDIVEKEKRGTFISYFSATSTAGTSLGTLIGGCIGEYNINAAFLVQFIGIIALILIIKIIVREKHVDIYCEKKLNYTYKGGLILDIFKKRNKISIILICIMMLSFAITNYSSNVSYYLEAVFKLSPYQIGSILSFTGLVSLFMNTLVNPFLLKRYDEIFILRISAFLAGLSMIIATITKSIDLCLLFIFMYLAFSYLNMPLQQSIISKITNGKSGKILGMQNSARSIGTILGSLFTGIVFDINKNIPFLMCGILFLVTSIILFFIDIDNISQINENCFDI